MTAKKFVSGKSMGKLSLTPRNRIMAILALRRNPQRMNVISSVTIETIATRCKQCIKIMSPGMAACTFEECMFSFKGKCCTHVLEGSAVGI